MTHGVVAAPHHLASEVGGQILRDGGNAVDAAVAANAILCVVYPHMTSIGGDLFALVWPAGEDRPVGLEGAGAAGHLARAAVVRERGHDKMPERGAMTVTVPGTVAAWGRLIEQYGTFGFAPLLEPAASVAKEGFAVSENLAAALQREADWLMREPEAQRLLPPLKAGMTMRNGELGATLEKIARSGFGVFYRGDVGAAIVDALQRRGGFLGMEDLANHRSRWVEPLSTDYHGLTVFDMPPPAQGLVALGMLARLRLVEPGRLQPGPDFVRLFRQVRDDVYPLRDRYITDPAFAPAPVEPFLDPAVRAGGGGAALPEGDTICLCTADEHGNLVTVVQSVSYTFGSGVIAEGTGVLLHNRGCYFSLEADAANRLEPLKKTMHTLIPGIASRDGRPWAAFGTMGADGQPQIKVQVLLNLADHRLDPGEAVAAPRVRVAPGGARMHVEADYPGAPELVKSGLPVVLMPPRHNFMGHAQAIVVDGPGRWRGGADPRADGSVVAV